MKSPGAKSIARNAAYLIVSRFVSQIVRFAYVIALAWFLGPELYGLFTYGIAWYMAFLPIANFGLGIVLVREIGRDRKQASAIAGRILSLRCVLSLFGGLLCGLVGWSLHGDPATSMLLTIVSVALCGRSLALWTEQFFAACEVSRYTFQQEVVFRPLEAIVGTLVLLTGGGVIAVAIVHASIWWLQAVRGWQLATGLGYSLFPRWSWPTVTRLLVQAAPIFLSILFLNWLLQGPLVLYRQFAETGASVGQLALALQVFVAVSAIPRSISFSALPVLSRTVERRDGKEILFVTGMTRAAFLFGSAAGLTGMALGPWFVDAVFGDRFGVAGGLLGLAMWLLVPLTLGTAVNQVLSARGRYISQALCALAGAGLLTALIVSLSQYLHELGVLVATLAGMSLWALCSIACLMRQGGFDPGVAVVRPGVVAVLALAIYVVIQGLSGPGLLALAAGLATLLIGALALGVITPEERRLFLSAIPRRSRKSKP